MRILKRAALALLALLLLAVSYGGMQLLRRPSLEAYRNLVLPAAGAGTQLLVRHAGVATLLFDDGETAWMTDGFFSRPTLAHTLFGKIGPDEREIDRAWNSFMSPAWPPWCRCIPTTTMRWTRRWSRARPARCL